MLSTAPRAAAGPRYRAVGLESTGSSGAPSAEDDPKEYGVDISASMFAYYSTEVALACWIPMKCTGYASTGCGELTTVIPAQPLAAWEDNSLALSQSLSCAGSLLVQGEGLLSFHAAADLRNARSTSTAVEILELAAADPLGGSSASRSTRSGDAALY